MRRRNSWQCRNNWRSKLPILRYQRKDGCQNHGTQCRKQENGERKEDCRVFLTTDPRILATTTLKLIIQMRKRGRRRRWFRLHDWSTIPNHINFVPDNPFKLDAGVCCPCIFVGFNHSDVIIDALLSPTAIGGCPSVLGANVDAWVPFGWEYLHSLAIIPYFKPWEVLSRICQLPIMLLNPPLMIIGIDGNKGGFSRRIDKPRKMMDAISINNMGGRSLSTKAGMSLRTKSAINSSFRTFLPTTMRKKSVQ